MQKLLKYIILFGIFTLPLINSRITELLWFSFSMPVSWNYEFTKVIFFNIWSSLVISLFFVTQILSSFSIKGSTFLWSMNKKGMDYKLLFFFYIILLTSTFLSESPIISFLWNPDKSHSFLMWSNLFWLFIVFSSLLSLVKREYPKGERVIISFSQTIKTFIFSWIFVSIIWLKEYFFPTFNYGDLWNRLFSTFWHPNYLSIFLVSLMPFLYSSLFSPHLNSPKRRGIKGIILFLFIITLILTKSFIAIFLFISFNIYYFMKLSPFFKGSTRRGRDYLPLFTILLIIWFTLIYIFLPEKLHSFVSRYFLWETTIRIIFSDIKIFLVWWGLETLTYFFDNFKSEYVYVFENLWYTADRPHNIILNFFYHFWIWGLIFILGIYYKIFIKTNIISTEGFSPLQKSGWTQGITPTKISLILIFIFILFNPTNIVIYLLITILLAQLLLQNKSPVLPLALEKSKELCPKGGILWTGKSFFWLILFFYITIISIFWAYNSLKFYISENYSYKNNFNKALELYKYNSELYFIKSGFNEWLKISQIKTQKYYKYKIKKNWLNAGKSKKIIWDFLEKYNYAENYFYIWDLFWNDKEEKIAKTYYNKGLEKLPDLWNKNSKYYENFLVKKLKIDDHRLTSEKYWLKEILDRMDIE